MLLPSLANSFKRFLALQTVSSGFLSALQTFGAIYLLLCLPISFSLTLLCLFLLFCLSPLPSPIMAAAAAAGDPTWEWAPVRHRQDDNNRIHLFVSAPGADSPDAVIDGPHIVEGRHLRLR